MATPVPAMGVTGNIVAEDTLVHVLEQTDGGTLLATHLVSTEWRAAALRAWPALLARRFGLQHSMNARRCYAAEACWARGHYSRATVTLSSNSVDNALCALCVEAQHVISVNKMQCEIHRLPHHLSLPYRQSTPAFLSCRSAGEGRGCNSLPNIKRSLIDSRPTSCAAYRHGAAWGYDNGQVEVAWATAGRDDAGSAHEGRSCSHLVGSGSAEPVSSISAIDVWSSKDGAQVVVLYGAHSGQLYLARTTMDFEQIHYSGAACIPSSVLMSPAYGRCTAVSAATTGSGAIVAGWVEGHVEVVDLHSGGSVRARMCLGFVPCLRNAMCHRKYASSSIPALCMVRLTLRRRGCCCPQIASALSSCACPALALDMDQTVCERATNRIACFCTICNT